ncbi:MAG: hypothetical protein BGN96_04830 [Bacteroidales bacterium 45-6]|nr:MAG: hypothetical protein BGN96_04830 [Bacteroidales bacterium 45-6]
MTTDGGYVTQHVEYVPFGEVFIEEHNASWSTPYKFNGKELDEEMGLYYYGARYYDPRVSQWLVVDPLAEKYPGWSVYNYCLQNPIIFIDIDGKGPTPGWNRFWGGLRAVGGVAQVAAGAAGGIASSWTGVGAVAGGVAVVHGADDLQAGIRQLWTGEKTESFTYKGIKASAKLAGASENTADNIATWSDIGLSFVGSGAGSIKLLYGLRTAKNFVETAREGNLVFYSTEVLGETVEFGGEISKSKGVMTIKNLDIDGKLTNKLGVKGVKELIYKFGKEQKVKEVIIEGAKRTTGAKPGKITKISVKISVEMKIIVFEGWIKGMQKIPFIKLLNEKVGLSLKESKMIKDAIVDDKTMMIEVDDSIADDIIKKSTELGIICRIMDPNKADPRYP